MRSDDDQAKHQSLVKELLELFQHEAFHISGVDGVDGYYPPVDLHNNGYGDQEDKMPDIYAYDEKSKRYIIGEAKTGKNDLDSEHSLTQYNVYLDQISPATQKHALFYIILPASRVSEFNMLITHHIRHEFRKNIVVVQSKQWFD